MKALPCLLLSALLFIHPARACSRVLFTGEGNLVLTGRSMDWAQDMGTNLWMFPRGMDRTGEAGEGSIRWKSKYGSVAASIYEAATVDGLNEKGLVANVLYLVESDYGQPGDKPRLNIALWAQYVLDNFASVKEAVDALSKEPFRIVAPTLPNGAAGNGHLAISDSTGDSAIFEYVDGKLVVHHSPEYTVMTNSPTFTQQLALNTYWQSIGGTVFLPGTSRAADRFARASFFVGAIPKSTAPAYIDAVPGKEFQIQAMASLLGIVRAVSVPLGITTPSAPNIASTIWRTVADSKNLVYYFDSATSPSIFWVDLKGLDFSEKASVERLEVAGGKVLSGEQSKGFEPHAMLAWLPLKSKD